MTTPVIEDKPPAVTPVMGLAFIVGAGAVVGAYIGLLHLVGHSQFFIGLLFLFYWTTVQKADVGQIIPSALGSLTGLTIGFFLSSDHIKQPVPMIAIGAALFIIIYFFVLGKFATITNPATILMLTVATIPAVASDTTYIGNVIALLLSILIFASPLAFYQYLQTRRSIQAKSAT